MTPREADTQQTSCEARLESTADSVIAARAALAGAESRLCAIRHGVSLHPDLEAVKLGTRAMEAAVGGERMALARQQDRLNVSVQMLKDAQRRAREQHVLPPWLAKALLAAFGAQLVARVLVALLRKRSAR